MACGQRCIYASISNEETPITRIYGNQPWREALNSYRAFFEANNRAHRFVILVFHFDSAPVLDAPTQFTSSMIWDKQDRMRRFPPPSSEQKTLAELMLPLSLTVRSTELPAEHWGLISKYSGYLRSELDWAWGNMRNALRARHDHLIDLLQLIALAPGMAEQAIRETRHVNLDDEDRWSDAYIRRTHAEKRAAAAGWPLSQNVGFFARHFLRAGTTGGQFREVDRALDEISPRSTKRFAEDEGRKVLLVTPTLGTALLVYLYYTENYPEFKPVLLHFAQGAPARRAAREASNAVGGDRRMLIVDAQELVNDRRVDVRAASSVFITGPLQDKALYEPILDRAREDRNWKARDDLLVAGATDAEAAAEIGELPSDPVLLVVDESPIDRILVVEEYGGRVFQYNPFMVKIPVEIESQ